MKQDHNRATNSSPKYGFYKDTLCKIASQTRCKLFQTGSLDCYNVLCNVFKYILYVQPCIAQMHGSSLHLFGSAVFLLMAALCDDIDRLRCDPCLSVGDLEACLMVYFSRTEP